MSLDTYVESLDNWASKNQKVKLSKSFKHKASKYVTSLKHAQNEITPLQQRRMLVILVDHATTKVHESGGIEATDRDFSTSLNELQPKWIDHRKPLKKEDPWIDPTQPAPGRGGKLPLFPPPNMILPGRVDLQFKKLRTSKRNLPSLASK